MARDPVFGALVARGQGILAAAEGRPGDAVAELSRALELHDAVDPMPVERARTQLMLGGVQRRLKQRRAARETLTAARDAFEAAGAPLWAARARAELARVSGRAPAAGGLTETERRVAELIAAGLTNREVAAELFVTVRAVESTLTKLYAKLGVRSRTSSPAACGRIRRACELAGREAGPRAPAAVDLSGGPRLRRDPPDGGEYPDPAEGLSGQFGEPGDGGVDALVGGGERDPHVAGAGRAVELSRGDQDPGLGERVHRPPAVVCTVLGPQVQAGF